MAEVCGVPVEDGNVHGAALREQLASMGLLQHWSTRKATITLPDLQHAVPVRLVVWFLGRCLLRENAAPVLRGHPDVGWDIVRAPPRGDRA